MVEFVVCLGSLFFVTGCGKGKPSSVPPSDSRIVGSWTMEGSDYPLTNEYRADGTVVQHVMGQIRDPIPFRIEGDQLIVSLRQSNGVVTEDKTRYTLSGDMLTFIDSPNSKRVFHRDR